MWTELNTSPEENVTARGNSVSRVFTGPWEERTDFLNDLMASPRYPLLPNAFISKVSFSPHGEQCATKDLSDRILNVNEYTECLATVEYSENTDQQIAGNQGSSAPPTKDVEETKEDDGESGPGYKTTTASGSLELLTLKSSNAFSWKSNNKHPIPVDAVLRTPLTTFSTTHRLSSEPKWDQVMDYLGSTNKNSVTMPLVTRSFAPNTLLFDDFSITVEEKYVDGVLGEYWTRELTFICKHLQGVPIEGNNGAKLSTRNDNIGWQYFFNESSGVYEIIQRKAWNAQTKKYDIVTDGALPSKAWGGLI